MKRNQKPKDSLPRVARRKPYVPPRIESAQMFEQSAMACMKITSEMCGEEAPLLGWNS
jgi:hypothetical protein